MVTQNNHFYKQTPQSNFTRTIFLTIVGVFILATRFLFGFFILAVSMALLPVVTVRRRWIHQKQQKKGYYYGSAKITPDADDIIDAKYTVIYPSRLGFSSSMWVLFVPWQGAMTRNRGLLQGVATPPRDK